MSRKTIGTGGVSERVEACSAPSAAEGEQRDTGCDGRAADPRPRQVAGHEAARQHAEALEDPNRARHDEQEAENAEDGRQRRSGVGPDR